MLPLKQGGQCFFKNNFFFPLNELKKKKKTGSSQRFFPKKNIILKDKIFFPTSSFPVPFFPFFFSFFFRLQEN